MTTPVVNARADGRADAPDGGRPDVSQRWRPASPTRWIVGATVTVATVLRVMTASARFRTADEWTWWARSNGFGEALADGRFGDASAATDFPGTMPGVTTMWIGTAANALWALGDRLGLVEPEDVLIGRGIYPTLELGQVLMAVASGVLVGLIAWLTVRWRGPVAGAVAGVLIATEPFAVAHGAILHTDELVALCGVGGFLAAALALGVPRPTASAGRTSTAVMAGVLIAGALLTKLTAVLFLPGLALLVGWALVAATRDGPAAAGHATAPAGHDGGAPPPARPAPRRVGRLVVVGAGALLATVVVAYPALWADPLGEVDLVRSSAELGSAGHLTYFRGEVTEDPGPLFYPVALAFRATPWLLAGTVVAGAAIWVARRTRGHAVALACVGVPMLVGLSLASKKFDRYGLTLVVLAVLVIAVVVDDVVARARDRPWRSTVPARAAVAAGAVACVALVAWSAWLAPWGIAYFDPVLGGSARAERTVLVGWGEGLLEAVDLIEAREDGRCDDVTMSAGLLGFYELSCGSVVDDSSARYVLLYVNERQRHDRAWLDARTEGRELVGVVERRGIRYVEIWERTGPDAAPTSDPAR